MSNTSKPVTERVVGFVAACIAAISGDDAQAKSLKIQKRAAASYRSQIALKEATTLEREEDVEAAEAALAMARINGGELITKNNDYLKIVLSANTELKVAKQEFADHVEIIDFLKGQLALTVGKGK